MNLYDVLGWIIGIAGVGLFLTGLFANRIVVRSVPKCSACRYELAKDAYLTESPCPECGRIPQSSNELYTLRRSWKLVLIGLLLGLTSILVSRIPQVKNEGWPSILPMSIQVRMWADGDPKLHQRVSTARYEGRLSESQRSALRKSILEYAMRPTTLPGHTYKFRNYFRPLTNDPPVLREVDIVRLCENTSPDYIRAIFNVLEDELTPQSESLLDLRRTLAQGENRILSSVSWSWLLSLPNGKDDIEIIRSAMLQPPEVIVSTYPSSYSQAPPFEMLELMDELSQSPDLHIQERTCSYLRNIISYNYRELSQSQTERVYRIIIRLANSPHQRVSLESINLFDHLPDSLLGEYDELIRARRDDKSTIRLLRQTERMRHLQPRLIHALIFVSQDESRTIPVRLEAHQTALRATRDDTSPPVPPALPIYVEALKQYDTRTDVGSARFMKQFGSIRNADLLAAICVHMEQDSVTNAGLAARWIDERLGIRALIRETASDELPQALHHAAPVDQLRSMLINALNRHWVDDKSKDAIQTGLDTLNMNEAPLAPTSP